MDSAMGALMLVTPWLARDRFGMGMEQWGYMSTAWTATYATGCLLLGGLSDRIGSRLLVVAGAGTAAFNFLLFPVVPGRFWLAVVMVVCGIGTSLFWPALQSWLGRGLAPRELGKTLGVFNLFWAAGLMSSPIIVEPLYARSPFLAYGFCAACCAAIVPIALSIRKPSLAPGIVEHAGTDADREEGAAVAAESDRARADRFLLAAWIANSAGWFMMGSIRHMLQFFAPTIGVGERTLSHVLFLAGLVQLATFFALSRIHAWHYRLWPLLLSQAVAAAGMVLVFLAGGGVTLALGLALTGFASGMSYSASLFYSTDRRADPGKKTGFHEGLLALGLMLGPLAGGIAGERLGNAGAPFLLCACVLVLAIVAEAVVVARPR